MRIAIIAESFLPHVNGVTNSVLRVLEHLQRSGHQAIVIAPGTPPRPEDSVLEYPTRYAGARIIRVPTVDVPGINSLPVGLPMVPRIVRELLRFRPDCVHLASPFVLGAAGAWAARMLSLPSVAVYQTDVAGFAHNYRLTALSTAAWSWTRTFHNWCTLTVAPSSPCIRELRAHGVENVHHWGRGVDTTRFHPDHRSPTLRDQWLSDATPATPTRRPRYVVGYVGRLAAEKSVERLAALDGHPDIQLVVIGDGPDRAQLEATLPSAHFTGGLYGEDLPTAMASLDLLVHTGEYETFCQVIQEAHASGVPTIAPAAGGPLDLITPGVNGDLLPVATFTDLLTDAATALLSNADAPRAARAGVEGRTWADTVDQLIGYYRTAVYSHHDAAARGVGSLLRVG